MARKATTRASVKADNGPAKLKAFHDRMDDRFSFSRFSWERAGGPRESLVENFQRKLRPPDGQGSPAAAVHILLPEEAPQDYYDVEFLALHYEASLPKDETMAYAQLTMRYPDVPNLHIMFERSRSWIWSYFVNEKRLPVVLILHNPALVGSQRVGHAHAMVFPREVTWLGWGVMAREIASDAGRSEAFNSWSGFRDNWKPFWET